MSHHKILKVFLGPLLSTWLLSDLQIKASPQQKFTMNVQLAISIYPLQTIQRKALSIVRNSVQLALRPLLGCLYRCYVDRSISLPHLKCWKARLSRKGKMGVLPKITYIFFKFRFQANVARNKIGRQILCRIKHTYFNRVIYKTDFFFLSQDTVGESVTAVEPPAPLRISTMY